MSAPVLSWLFVALGSELPCCQSSSSLPAAQAAARQSGVSQSASSQPAPQAETPRPNPQSQSFSRGYGSILPTSLIYIVLSTRGCAPWRPDAVMSTARGENKSRHWVFKGHRERTGQHRSGAALPAPTPSRRIMRFQGLGQLC